MPIMITPEIEALEKELLEKQQQLADLKKEMPRQPVENYPFDNWSGTKSTLADFFGDHKYLVLIHNMGQKCKYCTMWANGFEGIYHHFSDKAGFVLVNHDDIETQKKFAQKQGWSFPIYSAGASSFSRDLGFADENNNPWPGVSTFVKNDDGKIELLAQSSFGPGDLFCSVWHFYNLLPEKYDY